MKYPTDFVEHNIKISDVPPDTQTDESRDAMI